MPFLVGASPKRKTPVAVPGFFHFGVVPGFFTTA